MVDLASLVAAVRSHPGLTGKRHLRMVSRLIGGDGEDAAVIGLGDERLALAAEAIVPDLVAAEPRVAGIAGVVATLNDIAATGAEPIALLDTVVGGEAVAEEALAGVRAGADLYGVPVVGGHTTIGEVADNALSVVGVGRCLAPLRIARAAAGDVVSAAICTDGELIGNGAAMPFFSHLRGPRRSRAADDLRLLPQAAETGELWAARDVSMPGIAGSLIQMLEGTGLGCSLEVEAIPRPRNVRLEDWLRVFMSYGFLLVGDAERLARRFGGAGIPVATVGTLDGSGLVRLRSGAEQRCVWDFAMDRLTGFSAG